MSEPKINLGKFRELVHTVERDYTANDLKGTDLIIRVLPDQLLALVDVAEAAQQALDQFGIPIPDTDDEGLLLEMLDNHGVGPTKLAYALARFTHEVRA